MKKTEEDLKKMLRQLSDDKIKQMSEQLDLHPYPVLLLKEYSRRFNAKKDKHLVSSISKQLLNEKKKRANELKILKTELKNLSDYNITQSGIVSLSPKSIENIHKKIKNTTSQIVKSSYRIEKLSNEIIRLEKFYKELTAKNFA